jgi:hypothetical protein
MPMGLDDAGVDAGADAGLDSGTPDAGVTDAGAPPFEVEIRVNRDGLGPNRLYCLATTLDDAGVALLIDTGSGLSFLTTPAGSPDYIADAGALWLGPLLVPLAGRPYAIDETIEGRPVVGILGDNFLLATTSELDLNAQRLRRIDDAWDAGGWLPLPFETVDGYIYARVHIDPFDLRLGVDTGSPHTLLLDAGHDPSDEPVETQDAYGNPITLYLGTGELSWLGLSPHPVPVLRVVSFPSLEDSDREVGGEIDGLFGLTSWPGDTLRFDPASSTLWFGALHDGGT